MKSKILIPLLIVTALLVIGKSQYPKLSIATGYGAKTAATAIFVAGRDPQIVKMIDLNYSIVKYSQSVVDFEHKSVTTSFWGMARQTAVYREGLGCCLVGDQPADSLQKRTFTPPSKKRDAVWRIPWPDGDLRKDTVFPEIDTLQLKTAINSAFGVPSEDKRWTAAVVVLYKGELIAEKYASDLGVTPDTRIWGWSMTKSIMNAMAGVLTKQGKLDINATAPVTEWLKDHRRDITINDLMHMSSGLKWDEDYGDISSVTTMLYKSADCYEKAISEPYRKAPGSEWKYSSGTTNILSGIMRTLIGDEESYLEFPYREIFNKIGISSMILETDAAGNFVGSSYSNATARDWARFGLLYYNDGVWKNDTIFPKGWVEYTRTPATASKGEYGAQFWLNKSKKLPDVPEDLFFCDGHRGQRIFIIPSRDLVIVRLGYRNDGFNFNDFLKDILGSIKQ